METKANYAAVGAFVLACMVGFVVTILWLAGIQYSQEYSYFQTNFKGPVTGLSKGTVVRYNGIEVGRITDLVFNPADPQSVIVTMQVQPDLNIRTDSEASIESEGITGGSYVEISGGTAGAPLLTAQEGQKYPVLRSKQSTLRQLAQSAPELMAKLNVAADRLNLVLNDDNRRAFSNVLANLDVTTHTLAARSNDIDAMLRNINTASARLAPVLDRANQTFTHFDQLATDTDDFVKGPALGQTADLLTDVRRLTESLTRLSDQINNEPTKLLFGDRRKGYTPK